ncbi:MAG: GAF domain-containing protein [Anaerolineales bacterium]
MKFWTQSLMARLVSYFLVLLLLVIGLVGYVAFAQARSALEEAALARLNTAAHVKEGELNRWIDTQAEDVRFVAALPIVPEQLAVLIQREPSDAEGLAAEAYQSAYDVLTAYLNAALAQKPDFNEIEILSDVGGRVLVSTNKTQEGEYRVADQYYIQGKEDTFVQNVYPSPVTGDRRMTIATPILAADGERLGVLVVHLNLEKMDRIVLERVGLGESGEAYLVDRFNVFVSSERFGPDDFPRGVHTVGIDRAVQQQQDGSALYVNYAGTPVLGVYRWIEEREVALLVEMAQEQAFAPARRLAGLLGLIGLPLAVILGGTVYWLSRRIAHPILEITDAATRVVEGDLEARAPVATEDEVGLLARTFNQMTQQLRQTIGSLEQQVESRTRDLERRATYLEASAEVGRAAASILDTEQLIQQIVALIRERFTLYYVGLFLIDEAGEWAVLRTGTGEAGQVMLARGHRLRVAEDSMIGWSIVHAQARVAQQAESDEVREATSELPDTRSEAALPLRARGQVIGALTVQDDVPGAFDPATITVLQTMADQVAVALDNARLFAEAQQALRTARQAYGELSRQAWMELLEERHGLGYRYRQERVFAATGDWPEVMQRALQTEQSVQLSAEASSEGPVLAIPLRVRGEPIGVLRFCKRVPSDAESVQAAWTESEQTFLQGLVDQLGDALESARLFQESQRRAAREQLASEITAHIRESLDMETVARRAIQELGHALDADAVTLQLGAVEHLLD